MIYTAHKCDERVQTVKEHSQETADLCQTFTVEPWQEFFYNISLLHDIGKYQESFQKRINGNKKIKAPHSICGAKTSKQEFGSTGVAIISQYVIAGHHSGLQDIGTKKDTEEKGTLYGNLARQSENYDEYKNDIIIQNVNLNKLNKYIADGCTTQEELAGRFAFITRYCFSCLTDADWLNTEIFYTQKKREMVTSDFAKCLESLNEEFKKFTAVTELQKARAKLQLQAYEKINNNSSVYLMNMPTGSGKTLCSMKFALEKALLSGKKRIIYIIPYNIIIEQTYETFKNIFKDSAKILRHQSTYSFDNAVCNDEEDLIALRQSVENWDAQIILTTAVQFFESIYSNKRSKLRKLHNMADSILVFDEAHLMPIDYLKPCLRGISYITKFLNSSAVFLTATMPNYEKLLKEYADSKIQVLDLINDKSDFKYFNKCSFINIGVQSDYQIISMAQEFATSLVVVNSRKTAKELYNMCGHLKAYHLSTYMTAFDRIKVIDEIHKEMQILENDFSDMKEVPLNRRIIVISTSLIEAGVDLDFCTAFRELWGLDSILQAGGRCNREGKRKNAKVHIFERENTIGKKQTLAQSITKGILSEFEDISCYDSINAYYDRLFFVRKDDIIKNSNEMADDNPTHINFKTYAENFRIIEDNTISVAVIRDEKSRMLYDLQKNGQVNANKTQLYTFSVKINEFNLLKEQGVLEDFGVGVYWLTNSDYYNENKGVLF